MYKKLLQQWAIDQGFETWSQDHAAVLRNLAAWLNQHATQQAAPVIGLEPCIHQVQCSHCCEVTEFEVPNKLVQVSARDEFLRKYFRPPYPIIEDQQHGSS